MASLALLLTLGSNLVAVALVNIGLLGADRLSLPQPALGSSGTWLLVGNDFRGGLAVDETVGDLEGDRADLVALIRSDADGSRALFVPRDTLVTADGFGEVPLSLTIAYGGSTMLLDGVSDLVVRPSHYVELRLEAFPTLVNAFGGVEIDFQHEGRDLVTGFATSIGPRVLNGEEALAFVRARQYETSVDGEWVPSLNGDLDRICREQLFLGALIERVRSRSRVKAALWMLLKGRLGSISIDASTGGASLVELLKKVSGSNLELLTLPVVYTVGQQSSPFGPAHVGNLPRLEKDGAKAGEVVDYFLGSGPRPSFDPGLTCSI